MHIHSLFTGLAMGSALAAAEPLPRSLTKYPVIKTTQGSVQGVASDYRDGIKVYKGIPFAASTAGKNRWKAPSAREPWTGVLKADTFGPQYCPFLNIWTPTYNDTADLTSKKLPVYVWVYGGRFEAGPGDVTTYDGSGLASKGIIVVTLNYRVGAFGFLALPALSAEVGHNSSENYSLLDQQFALRWVKENIANSGGNPYQVTVGGQSAGSSSSLAMMYSPLSRDLINGVISESGARGPHDPVTGSAATNCRTKAASEAYGVKFQKELNASSIPDMRQLSMDSLISYGSASDTIFEGTQFENLTSSLMEPPEWLLRRQSRLCGLVTLGELDLLPRVRLGLSFFSGGRQLSNNGKNGHHQHPQKTIAFLVEDRSRRTTALSTTTSHLSISISVSLLLCSASPTAAIHSP